MSEDMQPRRRRRPVQPLMPPDDEQNIPNQEQELWEKQEEERLLEQKRINQIKRQKAAERQRFEQQKKKRKMKMILIALIILLLIVCSILFVYVKNQENDDFNFTAEGVSVYGYSLNEWTSTSLNRTLLAYLLPYDMAIGSDFMSKYPDFSWGRAIYNSYVGSDDTMLYIFYGDDEVSDIAIWATYTPSTKTANYTIIDIANFDLFAKICCPNVTKSDPMHLMGLQKAFGNAIQY